MTRRAPDLLDVARRLTSALGESHCVLIGGLAVAAYGYVRATDDVDIVVDYPLAEARRRLSANGIPATARSGDPLEGDFPCLKGTLDDVPFDILPPLVHLEWERSLEIETPGGHLRLVDLDGLLRLKLKAQGVQDILDVAVLVLMRPELRERAREIATAYRVVDRLDAFLADRRAAATAGRLGQAEKRRPRTLPRSGRRKRLRPSRPRGRGRS